MIPRPSVTLTVTPPGGAPVDYSQYLTYSGANQQMVITQNFGRQGDTAVLPLTDEYSGSPHVIVKPLSQVKLYDNGIGKTLFAGVVTNPGLCVQGPNLNEWDLNCTDYTFYADNAIVRTLAYGQSADQVIIALTRQARCGISAAPVSQGGYVAPAPVLPSYVLNYNTLSYAWRQLATLAAQSTPYGWYVDEFLQLHFLDQTTAQPSGVTFTTAPAVGGSATEGHFLKDSQFLYEWDGTSVRNRILVQGATQTITTAYKTQPPTDTWLGDGVTQAWPLRYTVTGSPVLQVGGAYTAVTVVTGGGTATGPWVVSQNTSGSWFLHAASPPAAGTLIRIWYNYQVPIVAQAQDAASQALYTGPNGGVFTEFISDTSLSTMPMALARAMRERVEYAFAAERCTFNTSPDWVGWVRAGQTCTVDNQLIPDSQRGYALGVNDTFIVTANRVTFTDGGYRTCQVTAVRL